MTSYSKFEPHLAPESASIVYDTSDDMHPLPTALDPMEAITLKVVLIGDSGVGKTNLVRRFCKNSVDPHSKQTVGFEYATKTLVVGKRKIQAQIWDTAGQERFQALTAAYYRKAVGAMLVYDITDRASFQHINRWVKQIQDNAHENIMLILVGNKTDLLKDTPAARRVSTLEAVRYAERNGMDFVETSAFDSTNVLDAFKKIIVPVGRLLSPQNPRNVLRLPPGWRRVVSRTRHGEHSYENLYTKERVAFTPTEPAKQSQYNFQVGQGLHAVGVTVTKEIIKREEIKQQSAANSCYLNEQDCYCTSCVIL